MFIISMRRTKSKGSSYLYKLFDGFVWVKGPKRGARIYKTVSSASAVSKMFPGSRVIKIKEHELCS